MFDVQHVSDRPGRRVSSYLPEVGQSLSDCRDGTLASFLDVDPDSGTFGVRPEFLVETFLQDCDPDTQAQAADRSRGRACW